MSEESIAKRKATMIAKHGSEEAWHEYMKELARRGGKKSRRHLATEQATEIGKLGGLARAKNYKERKGEQ